MLVQLQAFLFFPNSSQQISDPKRSCLLGGASARKLTGTSDNFTNTATPAVKKLEIQKIFLSLFLQLGSKGQGKKNEDGYH